VEENASDLTFEEWDPTENLGHDVGKYVFGVISEKKK